ncbi:unnamed protein product [Diatraea saccharalis]|uniref:Uncharacterized protein n=1 Tax=Diatraea saccharalis TaxID=40085 RepID=A0A9N9R694_9NEOP|nr:unnamed protein product [Diatraea saccharalis]
MSTPERRWVKGRRDIGAPPTRSTSRQHQRRSQLSRTPLISKRPARYGGIDAVTRLTRKCLAVTETKAPTPMEQTSRAHVAKGVQKSTTIGAFINSIPSCTFLVSKENESSYSEETLRISRIHASVLRNCLSPLTQNFGELGDLTSSCESVPAVGDISPASLNDHQQTRLTEMLLNKHNADMEKEMLRVHCETRSSKGEREKIITGNRQKKKKHLSRRNGTFQQPIAVEPAKNKVVGNIRQQGTYLGSDRWSYEIYTVQSFSSSGLPSSRFLLMLTAGAQAFLIGEIKWGRWECTWSTTPQLHGVKRTSKLMEVDNVAHKHHCPTSRQPHRRPTTTTNTAEVQVSAAVTTSMVKIEELRTSFFFSALNLKGSEPPSQWGKEAVNPSLDTPQPAVRLCQTPTYLRQVMTKHRLDSWLHARRQRTFDRSDRPPARGGGAAVHRPEG